MAQKSIAKNERNRSKAEPKVAARQAKAASKVAGQAGYSLGAIEEIGQRMKLMPITGWTMQSCLLHMVTCVRHGAEAMPVPSDPKLAKRIKVLVKYALGSIDALKGAAALFGSADYDNELRRHEEVEAIGIGIEQLAKKALGALDEAACLLDADFIPVFVDRYAIRSEFGLPVDKPRAVA